MGGRVAAGRNAKRADEEFAGPDAVAATMTTVVPTRRANDAARAAHERHCMN